MLPRYLPLFCFSLALLRGGVFSLSPESVEQIKRVSSSDYPDQSSKPSIQDLAVALAKKHLLKLILSEQAVLEKIKESVYILHRDSCTNIKTVGEPVAHNTRQLTQGAWMKDPLGIMGTETIFTMEGYSGKDVVEEFENMDMFKAGISRKTYKLPHKWDGTGGVVYGPYLYYNRENSNYVDKFNLRKESVDASIAVGSYSPRKNNYQWGGNSGMDLAVDEQGLWVLFGSTGNNKKLYASKIDVFKNVVIQTWALNTELMNAMGNAFVTCGVIYCIDSYNAKSTTINFAYDTKTSKQWNPNIQFTNQYGYNSMVDYNPRERVLYAWDNKRQVTYPITFEKGEPSK